MTIERHEFAKRLESLLTDFRFTAGRPARRSDGVVDVWVQSDRSDDGREHHVITVYNGLPGPSLAGGLWWAIRRASDDRAVRVGLTNGRGQAHVRDLEPGEYALDIEAVETVMWPPPVVPRWRSPRKPDELPTLRDEPPAPTREGMNAFDSFMAQPAESRDRFSGELFSCKSEALVVRLRLTAAGHMILEAEDRGESVAEHLAQARVWDEENRPLAEGYVGLYPVRDRRVAQGELRLDLLAPDLREMISRGCVFCFGVASRVRSRDRQVLERSLSAAVQPAGRRVLEAVLATSAERSRERSASAAEQ